MAVHGPKMCLGTNLTLKSLRPYSSLYGLKPICIAKFKVSRLKSGLFEIAIKIKFLLMSVPRHLAEDGDATVYIKVCLTYL